jgi:hypothetical protein
MSMKATAAAALVAFAAATDLSLTWKDCGGAGTKTKITSFSPSSITLGQKTTMTGKGDLSEEVSSATFDLSMTGAIGQLLHCAGDASVSKTCNLPLGTGSLTFEAMKFPIASGSVPVNVDISLSSALPASLAKTKTITKATAKNGDDLFCIEIDSAKASEETVHQPQECGFAGDQCSHRIPCCEGLKCQPQAHTGQPPRYECLPPRDLDVAAASVEGFVDGGKLNLAWSDCGDSSYHAKVQSLAPTTLPIGKTTTVTGSGKVDKQVSEGAFEIVAKFGPVTEHYSGDICAKKVFHLPAFLGQITWDGLSCPVATGDVSVGVDVKLASIIPAKLAVGDISIKAAETSGSQDHLICLDIKTSGAKTVIV